MKPSVGSKRSQVCFVRQVIGEAFSRIKEVTGVFSKKGHRLVIGNYNKDVIVE